MRRSFISTFSIFIFILEVRRVTPLSFFFSFFPFVFSFFALCFVFPFLDALAGLATLVALVAAELVAAAGVGLGVLAVEATEVLGHLASVAAALQEDGVLASGALQRELVKRDRTTTRLMGQRVRVSG